MSAQKIVNKFRKFGLPVDGVAILRNDILAIGDRTIDVHSCNYGYIRTSGRKRYSKGQQITGCDFLNNVTEDLFLVLIIDEGKKLDAYINAARQILDADSDVTLLEIDVNKEAIQRAESIPPSLNKIAKISFQYTYQEVGKCDEGVCEYVEDVQCDVEPCESKSFCERVQECIGSVDSDCTLQVGSGCCDYSVEGIRLQAGLIVCFQDEYMWDLETSSPTDISFEGDGYFFIIPIQSIGTLSEDETTYTVTTQNIIDWANGYDFGELIEVVAQGNCLTILLKIIGSLIFPVINWQDNTSSVPTEDLYTVTDYAGGSIITQIYPTPEFPNKLTYETSSPIQPYFFQVLINDVWTDVTDEVIDGVWTRSNVCDGTQITEWRIIDSEDNVINSGDVTATCEESTQVTDSVCNWLQAHQAAIEELQNNPTGLTCDTLPNCQTIIDIEQTLTEKANTADLATVAITGSYNDLSDQPTIPAAQIQSDWNQANNAALDFIKNKPTLATVATSGSYSDLSGLPTIPTNNNELTNGAGYITSAALNPLAFFSGSAGHTGDTNETIVQTISVASTAWATNAVYQILARVTRIAGSVTFRVRFNTTPDLTGTPISILEFATLAGSSNPNRLLIKTGNSFEYSTLTTISDLTGQSTTATATVSTASTTYIMLTIQGSTNAANGNFIMLNIARQ